MWATRLWWLLRSFGFDDAHVLDGGWAGWLAAGAPVAGEAIATPPAVFTARPVEGLFVDTPHVAEVVGSGGVCLIDALSAAHYRGDMTSYARPGHIPGAINVPAAHLLDRETGCFKPLHELRAMFAAPLESAAPIVTYCGGGIAATADAFVLAMLGRDDVAVYDGSLSAWTADPTLPMELG